MFLGKVDIDIWNSLKNTGELTEQKIKVLKLAGVKPYEISHIKNGTTNKIAKKRLKLINELLKAKVIKPELFEPLNSDNKKIFSRCKLVLLKPIEFNR